MESGKIVTAAVIFGVGLIMLLIIGFTIITNLSPIQKDVATSTRTVYVVNESGYINSTGYNVSVYDKPGFTSPVITHITNGTTYEWIDTGNATISSAGEITNASALSLDDVTITYNYGMQETTASIDDLRLNASAGVKNVSNKLPTIFLVAAIVIVMSVLLILWSYYKRMNIGEGGSGGSSAIGGEL